MYIHLCIVNFSLHDKDENFIMYLNLMSLPCLSSVCSLFVYNNRSNNCVGVGAAACTTSRPQVTLSTLGMWNDGDCQNA